MVFIDYCRRLEWAGYSELPLNREGLRSYSKEQEGCIYLVQIWNESAVAGLCPEIIDQENNVLKRFFYNKEHYYCKLLNIICTRHIGISRRNMQAIAPVWFIDLTTPKLIIYEGQPADYNGLRSRMEADEAAAGQGRNTLPRSRNGIKDLFAHSNRRKPYVNWLFILANIIVYVIMEYNGNTQNTRYLLRHGALNVELILEQGEYYRLFTSMFMHAGFYHLFNNMLVLWYIGDNLERAVGHVRYFIMYLLGGLLANLAAFGYYYLARINVCCVGASGAVFSVVGALFYIVIVNRGRLEDLTAVKLGGYIFFSICLGIQSVTTSNSAHIGGLAGGIILAAIIYGRRRGTKL